MKFAPVRFVLLACTCILIASCSEQPATFGIRDTSRVAFEKHGSKWTLLRNGQPYYIKGAHGHTNLELLASIGGNSIMVYEVDLTDSLLDAAQRLGLSVSIVLEVARSRYADYSDTAFIYAQRRRIAATIQRYYQHPALLFWVVGNELHLMRRNNVKMWKEVNELSRLIHAIDKYHPTTTILAAFPSKSYQPTQIKFFAPDLDFYSLNIYEFATRIKRESESYVWGFDKPMLVSEWSGDPYWACPHTEWDAVIEPNSTANAAVLLHNEHLIFKANEDKCIGGYVFYWGQKQERTHTFFSLILDGKYKTQALENIQYIWTKTWPAKFAPRLDSFAITSAHTKGEYLPADSLFTAYISAKDPEQMPMSMRWEIRSEGYYAGKVGGDSEDTTHLIDHSAAGIPYSTSFSFRTPEEPGQYRLFVYVYDMDEYVTTANIPLYILKSHHAEESEWDK